MFNDSATTLKQIVSFSFFVVDLLLPGVLSLRLRTRILADLVITWVGQT